MNAADKILNEIDLETIKKWAYEYALYEKEKKIRVQEMLSCDSYINWLNDFTLKYSRFNSDDWLYFPNEISKDDLENVDNLYLFYSGLRDYAYENSINSVECNYGDFYKIKYDEIGYEVGIMVGQGAIFFCNRVKIYDNDFIDFNKIINNNLMVFKK